MSNDFDKISKIIRYDPETGHFFWLVYRRRFKGVRPKPGDRADKLQKSGYATIRCGEQYFAHRVAFLLMTGDWPKNVVDHINRDKADNRWANLRDVTVAENLQNQGLSKNNRTGHIGISIQKDGMFRVTVDRKYVGQYMCITSAVVAKMQFEAKRKRPGG